jgi:hypothetical protein
MHGLIDETELGERRGWKEFDDADGEFIGGVGMEGDRHGCPLLTRNMLSIFSKKIEVPPSRTAHQALLDVQKSVAEDNSLFP